MRILFVLILLLSRNSEAQLNKIVPIKLSMSNAYLIRGEQYILIDCGGPNDLDQLKAELSNYGIVPEDLAALILTHGHHDHSGLAWLFAENKKTKIFGGKEDLFMFGEGKNDFLKPTNFTAVLMKLFAQTTYRPVIPSVLVDGPIELHSFGVSGKIVPMPGHTPGSLVVVLNDGTAFVGDMILGGFLGGLLFPSKPQEHYYHSDRERNRSNIGKVLQMGVQTFHLGHGGPVTRDDVIKSFRIL